MNDLIDAKLSNTNKKSVSMLFIVSSNGIKNDPGVHQGVAILAGICEINGVTVTVIDYTVEDYDQF